MGELIHTTTELKKNNFKDTKLTRSDFSFADSNQYAILRLEESKTDVDNTGVQVILAATDEPKCPVSAPSSLFVQDPRQADAIFFRLLSSAFFRENLISILKKQIAKAGLLDKDLAGHSFKKGAPHHASDHSILDESIQKLGSWSSNAFKLYLRTTTEAFFNLNLTFQKSIPLSVLRALISTISQNKPATLSV